MGRYVDLNSNPFYKKRLSHELKLIPYLRKSCNFQVQSTTNTKQSPKRARNSLAAKDYTLAILACDPPLLGKSFAEDTITMQFDWKK